MVGVIAEFDLDHTEEVKRWLLSFGRHANVLEPPELRRDIAAELTVMLEKYAHTETSVPEGDEH